MKAEEIEATEETITQSALDSSPTSMISPGSVLMVVRSGILKHTIPVAINSRPVTVNQDLKALSFDPAVCLPKFFLRWVQGLNDMLLLAWSKQGATVESIEHNLLADTRLALPTRDEQRSIVAFLDRETAKIDALIAEQEKLIALLAEKRQATISRAVTHGLSQTGSTKESGVPWLGRVPAHWEVKPLGHLCTAISYGFTNPMPTTDDGPYLLTANDIAMGEVRFETARRTSIDAFNNELTEKSRPKAGDVLITKDGTLGRVALFDGTQACINQSVASLRPAHTSVRPDFLALALSASVYQDRMVFDAGGTTIKHVYISRLAKMPVAVPPLAEQTEITAHLDAVLHKQMVLAKAAGEAADLLKERRSALITAAVTGQIDVRGAVQPDHATPESIAA